MVGELAAVRERFLEQRPHWKRVAELVESDLRAIVRSCRVRADVSSRTKKVPSLVKKLVKGGGRPLDSIRDRAGARVTVARETDIGTVQRAIRDATNLDVMKVEDTLDRLGLNEFDYRGVHLDVVVPSSRLTEVPTSLGDLWCEVQVRTAAQTLWADTAHPLYKSFRERAPNTALRAIHGLAAMMEIYDREIAHVWDQVSSADGYPAARVLVGLQELFFQLAAPTTDVEISLEVINTLLPLYDEQDPDSVVAKVEQFVDDEREHIMWVYEQYATDTDKVLLFQPESIMVFERLEHDHYELRERWDTSLPVELLLELALAWRKVTLDE